MQQDEEGNRSTKPIKEMDELTVADIYEQAAAIGVEIESQIRQYGQESVETLMPKIVLILEQLEGLVERKQRDATVINELIVEKESLMVEAKRQTLLRRQHEEKLEYLENIISDDTTALQSRISELISENEVLRMELEDKEREMLESHSKGDVEVMMKMKTTIDLQRDQIRELNLETERDKSEIEALEEQTNRLTSINENLRHVNYRLQEKLKQSTLERVEAKAQLTTIQQNNEEMLEVDGGPESNEAEVSLAKEMEGQSLADDSGLEHDSCSMRHESSSSAESSPSRSDPNRPRYTLKEMQLVLHERNLLKEQLDALQDELSIYRPPSPLETFSQSELEAARRKVPPRKESGVRKFFSFFYKKDEKPPIIEESNHSSSTKTDQ